MDRIRELDLFQKTILILLALMLVVFSVLYPVVTSRKGFEYMGSLLLAESDGGSTVYSGKIDGQQATFTVTADRSVTFRYGSKLYGPYTAHIDSSAIPSGQTNMTGVEILCGDAVYFRGAVEGFGDDLLIYHEDGSFAGFDVIITTSSGVAKDADGNIIDQMAPSAVTLLKLMDGPELESKADWQCWLYGLLLSAITAISILFADELFRWNLRFQIRNAYAAEPSDWELMSRYIAWTVFTIIALISFIVGLM